MPRVLIVDDDESMRLLLARILSEDLRVEVQLAGTCEQALRFARAAGASAYHTKPLQRAALVNTVKAQLSHG
jgi:DNA-binding response OmpR family regulator